jgi:hypothetical protein
VFAIPVILFPVAYVWYFNVAGLYSIIKEARQKRAARGKVPGEITAPSATARK